MKITLATYGSRGDVQPVLALALALQSAGHDILLAGPPENEGWAKQYGCPFAGLGSSVSDFLLSFHDAHSLKASLRFMQFLRREIKSQLLQFPDIIGGADLVLGASLVLGLPTVAQRMNIPYRFIAFAPQIIPSGRHPHPIIRNQHLPHRLNRLSWEAVRLLDRFNLQSLINRKRRHLGLDPSKDLWKDLIGPHVIVASNPILGAVPDDIGQKYTQVGYFHLEQQGTLGDEVNEFLSQGPPPVYFGFGSMPGRDQSTLRPLLLASARSAGQRAIISELRQGGSRANRPKDLCFASNLPHHLLFPKTAVVVHHGGAGTTATSARAGVPQIIVPHILDQFYWADRIHRLGLGPKPIRRSRLTRKRMRDAIKETLSNPGYRRRAREISRIIRKQDSLGRAVRLIEFESFLKKP